MKKLLPIGFFLLMAQLGFSQSFMHGAGLNIFVATASGGSAAVNEGLTYSPRFNFIEQDNMSVAVGIPITVGISGSYSSNSSTGTSSSLAAMLDVPVLISLNMGCGSTKENESRFGYFVAAGYGYHAGTYNISDAFNGTGATKFNSTGPVGNAGIRIGVGHGTHNIEVRLQYMKVLGDFKTNIFGIGSCFNF